MSVDAVQDSVDVLQEATVMLAGVALASMRVLDGAISLPQFRVLATVGALGRKPSRRAAEALGLDRSTLTRMADRLVLAGYVARGSDPGNRAVVTLELTSAGCDLVSKVAQWRQQELSRILHRLSPTERVMLTQALRRLLEVVGDGYGPVRGQLPM